MNTYTQYRVNHPSLQFSSIAQPCPTTCEPMDCSMPGLPVHHQLPEFTQIHVYGHEMVMPSNHLILCCPLLLPPPIFPGIRVASNESPLHIRLAKYWSFSLSISPSSEHPELISFSMDWLELLASKGLSFLARCPANKHYIFLHCNLVSVKWPCLVVASGPDPNLVCQCFY